MAASAPKKYRPETRLVHGGNAALAVRRDLRGALPDAGLRLRELAAGGAALQERRARLSVFAVLQSDRHDVRAAHGAPGRRGSGARDRDRHGRGQHRADGPVARRRSHRRLEAIVRLLPLHRRGPPAALRRHLDAGRRHRSRRLEEGGDEEHQDVLPGEPDQSQSRSARHRGDRQDRARRRRHAGGRQRVLDAAVPAAARARRRLRGLFGDQAHRRPGPLSRRRDPRLREIHRGPRADPDPADRAVAVTVQCVGAAQGPGDAGRAGAASRPTTPPRSRSRWRSIPR